MTGGDDRPDAQAAVIDWLASPAAHGEVPVERIDTHTAIVFLAGDRALKLKRAVRFDYVDFSTEALRRAACEAEIALNRRTAPTIYQDVVAVTREADGAFALDGRGTPVDWLVRMSRFRQEDLLDRRADSGTLDRDLMTELGASIASFHAGATRRDDHGGARGMRWVIDGNASGFADAGRGILDANDASALTREARTVLDQQAARLDRRQRDGMVRQCHGDLHLRNLVLVDGRPTLFDAIEFNDRIACVDVFYDLAFLLMDLWRRDLHGHANDVLNSYVNRTDDVDGLAVLPLFLSCRAAVRAKTSASAARVQPDPRRRGGLETLARRYLELARRLLRSVPPQLVAIGGLSGTGKSTLARAIAPDLGRPPGALVVRSDVLRKKIMGVGEETPLGADGYAAPVTARVYASMADRVVRALSAGHSAIADAVFARESDRDGIGLVATTSGVSFTGLWLEAPADVLVARVTSRTHDASDADAAVVGRQTAAGVGLVRWPRLDAGQSPEQVLEDARQACRAGGDGG